MLCSRLKPYDTIPQHSVGGEQPHISKDLDLLNNEFTDKLWERSIEQGTRETSLEGWRIIRILGLTTKFIGE